jgi:hypothetical protein
MQKTLMGLTALFITIAGLTVDLNAKSINRIDQNISINIINSIDDINVIGQKDIVRIIENIDEINISRRIQITKNISIERIDSAVNQDIANDINIDQRAAIGAIEQIDYTNNIRDIDDINTRIS